MSPAANRSAGFTLIESLAAMIVIAIALTGVLVVLDLNIAHSADPMIHTQAYDIASAYLDEIMPKDYGACQTSTNPSNRPNWQHVGCYNGLHDVGAHDQLDQPILGLNAYTINVRVSPASTPMSLCSQGNGQCADAQLITVTVFHNASAPMSLSAYRMPE